VTDEIRILAIGSNAYAPWDSLEVGVLFFFVLRTREMAPLTLERWEVCAKDIVGRMKTGGRFKLCGTGYVIKTWDTLTAAEYRNSDWLPY
jgi:hypothetical protein